jgi:phospholipid/cholesterol/gamma-HCH transport system permease protein
MPDNAATAEVLREGPGVRVKISGRLDTVSTGSVWNELDREDLPKGTTLDGSGITYCDSAGVALLVHLGHRGVKIESAPEATRKLLDRLAPDQIPDFQGPLPRKESAPVQLGRVAVAFASDLRELVVFTGQLVVVLASALVRPDKIRWGDFWTTAEKAGVNALLIVGMIGFLTGMIMAFQSTVPLRQFGVDIFVVNLVALSMLRELGVIMTSIVLAGRSGSAFAAEIGTMKVNEEVNALTTMGLDPVRFLVVPKVLAGIAIMPFLTMYANFLGIAGGLSVVMLFGHPWAAVWIQLVSAVAIKDVLSGLIKSLVFGFLIAAIGCLRGLQTKSGATAVGDSTTRAVVSGIFLIVLVDALFAFVFYAIGF